jgi:hypothetical protein
MGVLLALSAAASVPAEPDCVGQQVSDEPAQATAAPEYSTPDYALVNEEEASDPQRAAALSAWHDYETSVFESLSQSPVPRDWALATLIRPLLFDENGRDEESKALLQHALHATPDDSLILWIAMNHGDALRDSALRGLKRAEPDNAAVWLEDLAAATKRNDNVAIDTALSRMSVSPRFDNHFADFLKSIAEVFFRYPVPDVYLTVAPNEEKSLGRDAFPYAYSMSVTAAMALPAFQHLVNVCRINPSDQNVARATDCAAVGRMMVQHGDTVIANRIGYALLRVSHTFTDDDVHMARDDDWIYAQYVKATTTPDVAEIAAHQKDWIDTNSEMEAMRRSLERAAISRTPPEDWVDDSSLFSAERLQSDVDWFNKNSGKAK